MGKVDDFFAKMDALGLSLTYDDVRLRTTHSAVLPDDADVSSRFSRNVSLRIPISSAAMDTVTEHKMAIVLAQLGGIGVIHRGLGVQEQANEVAKVKGYLNGLIPHPISFSPDTTINQILQKKDEDNLGFNSFPIVDAKGLLVGLITGADFEFSGDPDAPVKNVMRKDVFTASPKTSIDEAYAIMRERKIKILPLTKDKVLRGMYVWKDVRRIVDQEESLYTVDANNQLRVAAAIGVNDFDRAFALAEKGVDVFVVDTAHGDSKGVIDTVVYLKKHHPTIDVVAGNISEPDAVARLAEAGVDGIKVGQGPGSICTTRIIAGIGAPQLSAVYECAKAAKRYDIPIIADGGLKQSGDIPIALAVGASAVMLGSMLAGTDESPGDIVYLDGRQWKQYRGMGSLEAMAASQASRERYGQAGGAKDVLVPEGIEGLTPYKGSVVGIMTQLVGGLRRGMGYLGAEDIVSLRRRADFRRLTGAGVNESHPHDVRITKDAPNYKR